MFGRYEEYVTTISTRSLCFKFSCSVVQIKLFSTLLGLNAVLCLFAVYFGQFSFYGSFRVVSFNQL